MKRITISVDDETHRVAQTMASRYGKSVSELLSEYLENLTAGYEELPATSERTLSEIIDDIVARGGGVSVSDNLSREELYDRDALR